MLCYKKLYPQYNYDYRMITEVAAYFMTLNQLDVVKHHILARYVIYRLITISQVCYS